MALWNLLGILSVGLSFVLLLTWGEAEKAVRLVAFEDNLPDPERVQQER